MPWTKPQQDAISAKNDTLLVSAAAGSGKTAVLVERVYELLRANGRIDRMLIVTFTRAAAGEMRERIEKRLSAETDPHLKKQSSRVGRAMISTLHAFCQKLLREHFSVARIDPMFRLGSENELMPLREMALSRVMEESCAHPTADEEVLFSQFEDGQIADMLEAVRIFALSRPEGFEGLLKKVSQDLSPYLRVLNQVCRDRLLGAGQLLSEMEQLILKGAPERYGAALNNDTELLNILKKECDRGQLTNGTTKFFTLPAKKRGTEDLRADLAEEYKQVRDQFKQLVKDARSLLPDQTDRAEETLNHTLPSLRALVTLAEKMENVFFELKKKKNILDFNDLEQLALRVLSNESARIQAAEKFDYIFVDEYQDVSGIQEAIVSALHIEGKNSLFLVGDVKQSIYRFRLADPTLFLKKYEDFSLEETASHRKILLNANFRSSENILASVNQIFSHAMRRNETEIDYDEKACLYPGGIQEKGSETELTILVRDQEEKETAGEENTEMPRGYLCEGHYIASRIREMMRNDTVPDLKGGRRPIHFKDIVILLRSASGRASQIAKLLEKEGIPVYCDADGQYFDQPEVRDLTLLLEMMVNPYQDTPLLGALRCPCFRFQEEELARIRLVMQEKGAPFYEAFLKSSEQKNQLGEKCRQVMETLDRWRFLSSVLPLDTFLWLLLDESGLYLRAGSEKNGEERRGNLRLFAEKAQGDSAHLSIGDFLEGLENARRAGDAKSAAALGENEDVVRIMTMHKSKGLEFPVVFLMELSRAFKPDGDGALLRMDDELGCALKYVDGENRLTRVNYAMNAIKEKSLMQRRAEEARLLYVAMTRARDKLIMTASPRAGEKVLHGRNGTSYRAGSAKCMLDWILDALGQENLDRRGSFTAKNGSLWKLSLCSADVIEKEEKEKVCPVPAFSKNVCDPRMVRIMKEEKEMLPPLKTSVTALAHDHLRQAGEDKEDPEEKRNLPSFMPPEKPLFLQSAPGFSGARRGTVLHRALGFLPLELMKEDRVEEGVALLLEKGLFTPEEAKILKSPSAMKSLRLFYHSSLGQRLLKSPRVEREWSFTQYLHTRDGEFVQGTLDLCFMENGRWILCDYKTDSAEEEELVKRYRVQLLLYKNALEKITGVSVQEACIYSLHLKKVIPIAFDEEEK